MNDEVNIEYSRDDTGHRVDVHDDSGAWGIRFHFAPVMGAEARERFAHAIRLAPQLFVTGSGMALDAAMGRADDAVIARAKQLLDG